MLVSNTTAQPEEFNIDTWTYDLVVIPNTPLYYTQQGYGRTWRRRCGPSKSSWGRAPMPNRSEVDAWIASIDAVRNSVYPPPKYP